MSRLRGCPAQDRQFRQIGIGVSPVARGVGSRAGRRWLVAPALGDEGEGQVRAAIGGVVLEDTSIEGARGVIVDITGGPDLSLAEASEATALITKVADQEANVIYGIVTDESMGQAVKVTVIATGFSRDRRKARSTPVDLSNYVSPAAMSNPPAAAEGGGFYRKTPNAKAAVAGSSRLDLDVPAFLRTQSSGGGGGE